MRFYSAVTLSHKVIQGMATNFVCSFAFLFGMLCVGNVNATVIWITAKVVATHVDLFGNVYLALDQNFSAATGCPVGNTVAIPKFIAAANVTLSDAVSAKFQSLAMTSKAQGTASFIAVETAYGCQWGNYPIVIQLGG
jgi:hypothetical protein